MTKRKPSKLGAVIVDEIVCPIENLYFDQGKLYLAATIPTPCEARHGQYQGVLIGRDGKEVMQWRQRIDHEAMPADIIGHFVWPIGMSE